jgi:hypothetical protein
MPRVQRGAFFFRARKDCVRRCFIISVDRIFTSFVEAAFTSIFDVSAEIRAIACVYRVRHAD